MSLDCLSIGLIVADHLCTPIPRLPRPGEAVYCDDLPLSIGGCAANVAIDLARLGVNVGIVGCVGEDVLGRYVLETLRTKGVETSGIARLKDVRTAATLVINVQGEDRRFITTTGANERLTTDHLPLDRVRAAKILYVGGYLLLPALNHRGELTRLLGEARRARVKTVVDVVLGPGEYWPQLESVLAETDVFLPNEDEAAAITGLTDPLAQAERFRAAGAQAVVITRGRGGALLLSDRSRIAAAAYPAEFVGGTGAGDAFDAGYIAGMLSGEDELGCLRWGSALGASCVRAVGATDAVFNRAEAVEFMRSNKLKVEHL